MRDRKLCVHRKSQWKTQWKARWIVWAEGSKISKEELCGAIVGDSMISKLKSCLEKPQLSATLCSNSRVLQKEETWWKSKAKLQDLHALGAAVWIRMGSPQYLHTFIFKITCLNSFHEQVNRFLKSLWTPNGPPATKAGLACFSGKSRCSHDDLGDRGI